jgi:hypothetical protein
VCEAGIRRLLLTIGTVGASGIISPIGGSPDNKRIDIHNPNEIRRWSESAGITPEQLKDAVARVGASAQKVGESLGNRLPNTPVGDSDLLPLDERCVY